MRQGVGQDQDIERINMEFTKHDQGKLDYSLMPIIAEEEMVKVLMFGAHKYAAGNWRKVDDLTRYYNAAHRHMRSWMRGEKLDPETGLPHLSHAMCCLAFIVELENE